ncbi:hypothetical protein [Streptomyces sp. NPDC006510]|uniref:hypothetical protein n=1 Tax=Streptomyces sp. NPDC006510 TaxID=3155600 RepID=UPI0033BCAC62
MWRAGCSANGHVLTGAPADAWERISCGDGAKGPRVYDWAAAKLSTIDGADPTHNRWVLARRSLARPEEVAYYLAFAPAQATVSELVRVAGAPAPLVPLPPTPPGRRPPLPLPAPHRPRSGESRTTTLLTECQLDRLQKGPVTRTNEEARLEY